MLSLLLSHIQSNVLVFYIFIIIINYDSHEKHPFYELQIQENGQTRQEFRLGSI